MAFCSSFIFASIVSGFSVSGSALPTTVLEQDIKLCSQFFDLFVPDFKVLFVMSVTIQVVNIKGEVRHVVLFVFLLILHSFIDSSDHPGHERFWIDLSVPPDLQNLLN